MKKTALRLVRKSSHLSNRLFRKATTITGKIESKADRIIGGSDFTIKISDSTPLEKLYFQDQKWITPLNPAMPSIGQKASVTLLIPTLDGRSFYGGTATALVVAGRLAELTDRPLRVIQTLKTGSSSNLSKFLASNGINVKNDNIKIVSVADRAYNVYGYIPMHPDDLFIASAWWDAHLLQQLPLQKKFVYLVQDFEPIFYNNSDSYILAENTYKKTNFVPLCNTKLMYDFMKDRAYSQFSEKNSFWFEPAVSRLGSGSVIKKVAGEKKRLFVYGRPDVHRNLFYTALNAIDLSIKSGFIDKNKWEFYMAGQSKIPNVELGSGVVIKNLGKMDMEQYVNFSKTIDLAVSPMMAPHPNYPTLEFASIGAAVVTTKYANKVNLSNYSENIVVCDIDIESMAGAINIASKIEYKSRIDSTKSDKLESDWAKTLDGPLKKLVEIIV